jgi:surface carbohydrate biosynthesis protein
LGSRSITFHLDHPMGGRSRERNESEMKNIDVLFLIEHVDRELDAVTCVMEKLKSKFGIASDVRNYYYDLYYALGRYNPKVVVFPFFYGADHIFPITYVERWPNACFINMAWEQILVKLDIRMIAPRDEIAKNKINHLCWTRQHRDFLADHGAATDHLHLTGNPVMKFYEHPYKNYFDTRERLAQKYGLDPKRKWVLFPENYAPAFYSDHHLQVLATQQNADLEYLRAARTCCDRSLKQFFAWAKDLDGENDPILILRPRPATTLDQMVDFMRRTIGTPGKNLQIIKAETAREWILAADHVISSFSTTLIEAALAGKMIHMFAPEPLVEALESEWHRFAPSLTDRDSYLNAVRQTEIVKTGAAVAEWAHARLFPVGDPLDAIAEVISRLHGAAAPKAGSSIPDHQRLRAGQILVERIRKFIQRRPALHRLTGGYSGRATDIFGADDIAARVWRWQKVLKPATPLTL